MRGKQGWVWKELFCTRVRAIQNTNFDFLGSSILKIVKSATLLLQIDNLAMGRVGGGGV